MAKVKERRLTFVERVIGVLEGALMLSRAFERLLVDVVVAYVPLLAPVIPATIAFFSMYLVLELPLVVSLIGAGVVEFLGLGTVTTTMQFVDYNASRGADDPPAPTKTAVGTMVFYLIVVLTVNVMLDEGTLIHKIAKLLLSTLSVAGAITISLRGQHARRLEAKMIRDAKAEAEVRTQKADETAYRREVAAERRAQKFELKKLELEVSGNGNGKVKVAGKVAESFSEKPETFGKYKNWHQVPTAEKQWIVEAMRRNGDAKILTNQEIQKRYGASERVAYGWIGYAERDFGEMLVSVSSEK